MSKLRWAVIGTGTIAATFAEDIARTKNATLVAVLSRNAETGANFARRFGPLAVFANLDALAEAPGIDAVYIASPNTAHFGQAKRLITAGKPLLVEKPLVATASEAQTLAMLAKDSGVFAMEGLWTLYLPALERLRNLLAKQAIGRIRAVRGHLSFAKPFNAESRFFSPALGGGALLDLGVYPLAVTLNLFGPPKSVSGDWQAAPTGVDLAATMRLDYDGFTVDLGCSFLDTGENRYVIEGETGTLVLDAPFLKAARLFVVRNKALLPLLAPKAGGRLSDTLAKIARRLPLPGVEIFDGSFPGGGLQFEIEAASAAILSGARQEPRAQLSASLQALKIIEEIRARPAS
ncbi:MULTISPECIES: Gfo/Idh/MocA family oxidoreductase [unclassified Rhizobium]|uniref:Gfo/Idh/MocA family protein n=1 Tax=unclassified Rhizobium TaxID=2613769 RepID=UPI00138EFE56|nr:MULTISPECIES: Gfo/Idh/MocA family oxidoreductase [unclassified Rhizobium]